MWCRPDTRLPAAATWLLLALCVHEMSGETPSRANTIFSALLSLPVVLAALAGYEVHERWAIAWVWGIVAVCVVAALHFLFFARAMIAAGSADYPYDD